MKPSNTFGLSALLIFTFLSGIAFSAITFSTAVNQLSSTPTDPVIRLQSTNLNDLHHRFGKPSRIGQNVALWTSPTGTALDSMLVKYEPGSKRIIGYSFSRRSAFGTSTTTLGNVPMI